MHYNKKFASFPLGACLLLLKNHSIHLPRWLVRTFIPFGPQLSAIWLKSMVLYENNYICVIMFYPRAYVLKENHSFQYDNDPKQARIFDSVAFTIAISIRHWKFLERIESKSQRTYSKEYLLNCSRGLEWYWKIIFKNHLKECKAVKS